MQMTFSNAENYQIPRGLFIAAWKVWFKRFSDDHYAWREGKMPLHNSAVPLHQLLNERCQFSVEVLSRLMVPWSFRDRQQVDPEFIRLNPAVLRFVECKTDVCDGFVEGARLTDQALDYWDSLTFNEQDLYLNFAEARIQADIETPSDQPCILDDAGVEIIGEDIYPPTIPSAESNDDAFIRALVDWIDEDPHQPMYQRKAVGEAVSGWHDRLLAYFWPKPRTGYLEYSFTESPLAYRVGLLVELLQQGKEWSFDDKVLAVKTAREVFMFAGLPQRQVTWENVQAVMRTVIELDSESTAKMNSGWSYLASMVASNCQPSPNSPTLISWNSRCSASVISRLDFLLVEAGIETLHDRFPNIGIVPGWGGTRPREYTLDWPSAYRSWPAMFAAGRLVETMVNYLNTAVDSDGKPKFASMPLAGGQTAPWTARGVQLVLFSDGY
ncbi:hypothetical protein [Pleionea litopenaei]|uniref:Uncharacterized protein n=1 Tax=Pleionea litopenaei TaxID=3070815 RepID=A0AA51RUT4_9GAMM|nr:hypothetical protein [Pleionea sp. HL-JVS1]WMS88021.1 hypothetical protein Q9312_03675 [Pleionea sp. HL-JVS1]